MIGCEERESIKILKSNKREEKEKKKEIEAKRENGFMKAFFEEKIYIMVFENQMFGCC